MEQECSGSKPMTAALLEARPLPLKFTFETIEAYDEAMAEHRVYMAQRRKAQERLRDQQRDRSGRARPCEERAKRKRARRKAKLDAKLAPVRELRRLESKRRKVEKQREERQAGSALLSAKRAEGWARIVASQQAERAAFEAQCAERLKARAACDQAAAAQAQCALPVQLDCAVAKPAPRWWTACQEEWVQHLQLCIEARTAAKANSASASHVDCVRCGELFVRSSAHGVCCPVCNKNDE